jgi:lauroyl/myristoyl acyltransferase
MSKFKTKINKNGDKVYIAWTASSKRGVERVEILAENFKTFREYCFPTKTEAESVKLIKKVYLNASR